MATALKRKKGETIPAVIYARYSGHSQREESIEGQLKDCHAFAEREGFFVVGEYIDRAMTAKTDDRPDFQRMINDATKGQFKVIIVWKLDRFARNRYDSAIYKAKLKKNGVIVVSAMENISDKPEGIILEGVLESMAEYYSANLSQNIRRGLRDSRMKGQYTGSRPPIGYKIENKRLIIDDDKAPYVRFVFEKYASGVTKKVIFDELDAKGFKNQYGKKLTHSSFQRTLRNKIYIGVFEYDGEELLDACPPLIDEKTFYLVQEKLSAKAKAPGTTKAIQEYLLQGKGFCGMCGARLKGESGTGKLGGKFYYYCCTNRKVNKACKKMNEKKGFLEWYVTEQTVEYVLTPERIDYIAARVVAAYDDEFNTGKIKEMESRILKLEGDIHKAAMSSLEAPEKIRKTYYGILENLEAQKVE